MDPQAPQLLDDIGERIHWLVGLTAICPPLTPREQLPFGLLGVHLLAGKDG